MERITVLYKEASALRVLAGRSEMQPIRGQLLSLAARCEMLAKSMEENQQAAAELLELLLVHFGGRLSQVAVGASQLREGAQRKQPSTIDAPAVPFRCLGTTW